MRVLVTGGAGFLGSFVVQELKSSGFEAVVLDVHRPSRGGAADVPVIQGGIEDPDFLLRIMEQYAVDRVIHLASFLQFGCAQNPSKAVEVNVQGTVNVLEACRRGAVKKVVFASSSAMYGPRTELIDEDSPILPGVSLYGATKFVGELLHLADIRAALKAYGASLLLRTFESEDSCTTFVDGEVKMFRHTMKTIHRETTIRRDGIQFAGPIDESRH